MNTQRKINRMAFLKNAGLTLVTSTAILVALTTPVLAKSGSATYDYLIGTGFLCDLDPSACPAIAMADNGDTVEITGAGTFSIHPNAVTGGGTFTHKAPGGSFSGTWTAEKLLSFSAYGCGGDGLPDNFCGGLAVIRVHLSPGFDAILKVYCELGAALSTGKVPPGHSEGVTLAIDDVINFDERISGFTVFLLQ